MLKLRSGFCLYFLNYISLSKAQVQNQNQRETFKTELFLNRNDLNSGLYEGEVTGRRRFGETQVPHGYGAIFYFSNDKYNRVNYTGQWVQGEREGNGTTSFRDGAVYTGAYRSGLEHGQGFIRYPNGNSLDAEFVAGKIMGHGVFKYASGDQREGFFRDNILDGQVIFTRSDGTTLIEKWLKGEKVEADTRGRGTSISFDDNRDSESVIRNLVAGDKDSLSSVIRARGGSKGSNLWSQPKPKKKGSLSPSVTKEHTQVVRSRARSFLFDIYSNVN